MSLPFHPPAAGGKTAWGVGELISRTGEDVETLQAKRKAAAEFNDREQKRLHSLKDMDKNADEIMAKRRERKQNFEIGIIDGADEFKNKQLEILKRLEENRLQRKLDKKERAKEEGAVDKIDKKKDTKEKKTKKKKKKKDSSSSSSDSSSSSSEDSSKSSNEQKNKNKNKRTEIILKQEPPKPVELTAEQKTLQLEAKRKAEEAKAKEREVKTKAKQQLAAFEAEAKKTQVEEEAKKQREAQRKQEDAIAKRKAEKLQKEEDETKSKADESNRKAEEALARKKAAEEAASSVKSKTVAVSSVREPVAGGFFQGQHVVAIQDITIRGNLIIRNRTAGTILGKADTDPINRISVKFVTRADGGKAPINCVPKEIRKG